jgi:YtkA-like protein
VSHPVRVVVAFVTVLLVAGGAVVVAAAAFGLSTPHSRQAQSVSSARIGPGPATVQLSVEGYRLELRLSPNRATAAQGRISVRISKHGKPVSGARIRLICTMLDMGMARVVASIRETGGGRYEATSPRLMFGSWGLRLLVRPPKDRAFSLGVTDRVGV